MCYVVLHLILTAGAQRKLSKDRRLRQVNEQQEEKQRIPATPVLPTLSNTN
jgi:hypothetical protein